MTPLNPYRKSGVMGSNLRYCHILIFVADYRVFDLIKEITPTCTLCQKSTSRNQSSPNLLSYPFGGQSFYLLFGRL